MASKKTLTELAKRSEDGAPVAAFSIRNGVGAELMVDASGSFAEAGVFSSAHEVTADEYAKFQADAFAQFEAEAAEAAKVEAEVAAGEDPERPVQPEPEPDDKENPGRGNKDNKPGNG